MISLRSSSKNSPGKSAPRVPAGASPVPASALSRSVITSCAQVMMSATVTVSAMARAVTDGMVLNWISGRGAGADRSARRPLTAAWVCSSCRSIRSRWAAISRLRAVTSGAVSTARIESSGMPRSRSRLMTCAAVTWSAP